MVKSKTVTVTAQEAVVPPPPEEWTHKLVFYFYRLPWATYESARGAIEGIVKPIVNAVGWLVGYDFVGWTMDWEGMTFTFYYIKRGTPVVVTAAVLKALLISIAVCAIAYAIVILGIAWLEREKRIAAESVGKKELLEAGKITSEQYEELVKAQKEEPAPWEKVVIPAVLIIVGLAALYVLTRKPPEERREYAR